MNTHFRFRFRFPISVSLQPNAILLIMLVGAMVALALRAGATTSSASANASPSIRSTGDLTQSQQIQQSQAAAVYAWQSEPPTDTPTPTPTSTLTPTPFEDENPTQTATSTPGGPPPPTDTPTPTPTPEGPDVTPTEPPMEVYVSSVRARFFRNLSGCAFNVTTATPTMFAQSFPVIGFNPVVNVIPCSVNVNQNTRPFTDVIPATPPTPCATQRAEATVGATPTLVQAGVGSLANFHAVFTGELNVPAGGNVTFKFYVDDSFVLGIGPKIGGNGEQPTYVSGQFAPPAPPPPAPWPTTPFQGYRVVGRYNTVGGIGLRTVTVNFPTGGFYPFEVDYTECSGGSLELVIGTNARNPIPPGPSATATIACLRTPLPEYWPWCTQYSTPTAAPSPPAGGPIGAYPQSFYIHPTNTPGAQATPTPIAWKGHFYEEGKFQAQKMIQYGLSEGLVILHFGQPVITVQPTTTPDIWGTNIFPNCRECDPPFHSSNDIKDEAIQFATGFADEVKKLPTLHPPRLILAVAINNQFYDNPPLPTQTAIANYRRHGQHWGNMIRELNTKLASALISPYVTIEGGNDIEIGFGDPDPTLGWAQGFEEVTRYIPPYPPTPDVPARYYYADAACDDCYPYATAVPTRDPNRVTMSSGNHTWDLNQLVGTTWANRAALPVPQIYYPGPTPDPYYAEQALQWQWVSMYSARFCIALPQYGIPDGIYGNLGFRGATGSANYPAEYTGGLAWQRLWQALKGTSCTNPNPGPAPTPTVQYTSPMKYATTAGYCIPRDISNCSR